MRIEFTTDYGVPPFREMKFTTKDTPVPRIGEALVNGTYHWKVLDVFWNYRVGTVFVHVSPMARAV